MSDLTPETHIKLSTGKFLAIVGFVVSLSAAAVWSYANTLAGLRQHMDDHEIHLDRDYIRDHGHPIGKWDLEVERNETTRRLDEMTKELKEMHDLELQIYQKRR